VTGQAAASTGPFNLADPRVKTAYDHGYRVLNFSEPSFAVHGKPHPGTGAYTVADPRIDCAPRSGAYGIIGWREAAGTITGAAGIDNGRFAVADPRVPDGPPLIVIDGLRRPPSAVPVILAEDGTWHRPLTTLELAVLQDLPLHLDGKPLVLAGDRVTAWRERIGNAIPCGAARAVAEQMLVALVEAEAGTFSLRGPDEAVWVRREEGWLHA
jgi:hypothetical protein